MRRARPRSNSVVRFAARIASAPRCTVDPCGRTRGRSTVAVQAALGGIGLYAAGVPGAGVLTALILILCLAQIGPGASADWGRAL